MGTDTHRSSDQDCPHTELHAIRSVIDQELTVKGDAFAVAREFDLDHEVISEHMQMCLTSISVPGHSLEIAKGPVDVTAGLLDHLRQRINALILKSGIDGDHKEMLSCVDAYNKTALNFARLKREYGEEFKGEEGEYKAIVDAIIARINEFAESDAQLLLEIIEGAQDEEHPMLVEAE